MSDGVIVAIVDAVQSLPGPECEVFIAQVGGVMARVAPEATAYPYRHYKCAHTLCDAAQDSDCMAWARDLFQATAPFATGSGYVNFMSAYEAERIEKVYSKNYDRFAEVKRRWDPENRFRLNQNTRPAS